VKWLLDTNVISEPARDRPHGAVIEWLRTKPLEDLAISIVTFAELQDGAESNPDQYRRQRLLDWVENEVATRFQNRVLALSNEVLVDWLRLSRRLRVKGITRDASDMLIAATARIYRVGLVTRNVRHFMDTALIVYDPWNDKTHHMETP
jgi:hypothetical protein